MMKSILCSFLSQKNVLVVTFLCSFMTSNAQKDSIKMAEQFLKICNGYKSLPLQLSVEYSIQSNYQLPGADTGTVKAEFYTTGNNAYVSFGEVEEIVDDSLALLVSTKLKRMLLYKDVAALKNSINAMYNPNIAKANSKKLFENYTVSLSQKGDTAAIQLESRNKLYKTGIPEEVLELRYDPVDNVPLRIIDTRRTLVAVSDEEEIGLSTNPIYHYKLLKIEDKQFAVGESVTNYLYKKISHDKDAAIPVRIADRITRAKDGLYHPADTFKDYILSNEN